VTSSPTLSLHRAIIIAGQQNRNGSSYFENLEYKDLYRASLTCFVTERAKASARRIDGRSSAATADGPGYWKFWIAQ
jgi:hypothetical protein